MLYVCGREISDYNPYIVNNSLHHLKSLILPLNISILLIINSTWQVEYLLDIEKKISSIPDKLSSGSVTLYPTPVKNALQGLAAAWKTQYAMVRLLILSGSHFGVMDNLPSLKHF